MSYEDAVRAYVEAVEQLNECVGRYNELRERHPRFNWRHRLETVPKETWAVHLDTRYTASKMERLRDGPLSNIEDAIEGKTNVGLKDKVSETAADGIIERLFGDTPSEELNEEMRQALDDVVDAVNEADKAARRLQERANDRYGTAFEREEEE